VSKGAGAQGPPGAEAQGHRGAESDGRLATGAVVEPPGGPLSGSAVPGNGAAAAQRLGDPAPPSDPAPVNILLVDDQPANLLALEAMLQGLGQNLIKAESGREALKWLLTHDFAVILLDVKMPEMDGFETAAMIRERDKSRDTPIIFLTAGDKGHTDAVRGYAVGAVDYLVKPVVPEIVRSKVAVFVELAKRTEQLRRQTDLLRRSEQEARELAEARAELVADLEHKNRELESFSYAVSHDLRAPLRRIEGFSRAVVESQGERMDPEGRHYLERVGEATRQMGQLIDDVLYLARVSRADLRQHEVDLSAVAGAVLERLRETDPARELDVRIRPGMIVVGDGQLLRIALENLLGNAWKFTAREPNPRIEFGQTQVAGEPTYFVRDNGAGFDMTYVDKLFTPFQRLHLASEFPGSGVGLATVQRIIHRHAGRVWAEGLTGQGATFHFTIGRPRA
jgi:two-component system, sensor histidine kinase and response regulator